MNFCSMLHGSEKRLSLLLGVNIIRTMFSNQDLMALLAVADLGSVRAAADMLHRTQPAVTQAIRRLEDNSGLVLLDRASYRAKLTSHGERFVERARGIVGELKGLQDLSALLSSGVEPRIRLALDCAIPQEFWLPLVEGFANLHPQTEVEIEVGEGVSIRPRLMAGDIDLAILFDASIDHQAIVLERIGMGSVEFSNVIRADCVEHLQADRSSLPQILVVDFNDPTVAYGLVEGRHYWRVSDHQMQVALICRGLGWGTVPRRLVSGELETGMLCAVSYRGLSERSVHSFSLYRRRDSVMGPAGTAIWISAEREALEEGSVVAPGR